MRECIFCQCRRRDNLYLGDKGICSECVAELKVILGIAPKEELEKAEQAPQQMISASNPASPAVPRVTPPVRPSAPVRPAVGPVKRVVLPKAAAPSVTPSAAPSLAGAPRESGAVPVPPELKEAIQKAAAANPRRPRLPTDKLPQPPSAPVRRQRVPTDRLPQPKAQSSSRPARLPSGTMPAVSGSPLKSPKKKGEPDLTKLLGKKPTP